MPHSRRFGVLDEGVEEALLRGILLGCVFGVPLHGEEPTAGVIELERFDDAVVGAGNDS